MNGKCQNCGSELPDKAKFCDKCGKPVVDDIVLDIMFCSKCGAQLDSGAKFCGKCGNLVSISDQELYQMDNNEQKENDSSTDPESDHLFEKYEEESIFEEVQMEEEKRCDRYCDNCGEEIKEETRFCPKCGKPLENNTSGPRNTTWENTYDQSEFIMNNQENDVLKTVSELFRKWWKLLAVVAVIFFVIKSYGGSERYINSVKVSRLPTYDYGMNIGDALHEWFDGTEKWDSYEEDGTTYVTAIGNCPYTLTGVEEQQNFYFKIIDKEHFRFIGAYNNAGQPICTDFGNEFVNEYVYSMLDWMSPFYDIDIYEEAIKAAFGNQESLNYFKQTANGI